MKTKIVPGTSVIIDSRIKIRKNSNPGRFILNALESGRKIEAR